ncbi:hypothetical protein JVU11DRAFT_9138 [Chiua virens]|nr:hypothetical protein JVU11DRAFT_9138 [Chiua virens]
MHFNVVQLADRIQSYMIANMEMLLESRILDDLDLRVVRRLPEHTRAQQATHSPVSRSDQLGHAALEKHKEWLALFSTWIKRMVTHQSSYSRTSVMGVVSAECAIGEAWTYSAVLQNL